MKHVRKYLAIVLAFILLAAVPLCAGADSSYDSYAIGSWSCYGCYDTKTKELTGHSGTSLQVNSNGTCTWYFMGESMSGTWEYYSTDSSGYVFVMNVSFYGSTMTVAMVYCTSGAMSGDLAVSYGDALYLYQRA